MPENSLSSRDRDLMIRTIIGEAAGQPPEGQAAVASVIMNRVAKGNWGRTPSSVVLSRGQFEPWQTRANELNNISPRSEQYQRIGSIVDSIASGDMPDPTGGATHFLEPRIVRRRRGGSLPEWARGPTVAIGSHNFYAPGNPSYGRALPYGEEEGGRTQVAQRDDIRDPFADAGYVRKPKEAAPVADQTAAEPDPFADAGYVRKSRAAAPVETAAQPSQQMLGIRPIEPWELTPGATNPNPPPAPARNQPLPPPQSTLLKAIDPFFEAIHPSTVARNVASDVGEHIGRSYQNALTMAGSGIDDIKKGSYLPSFPEWDPRTWSAGGLLKTAGGALGVPGSLIGGPADALGDLATRVTGNPEFGSKTSLLAGAAVPLRAPSVAFENIGQRNAINSLVKDIGAENVPAAVARVRGDPRLALMDVSDPVRTSVQGFIDPSQPRAQRIVTTAVQDRMASLPEAVNSAYTAGMGHAPDTVAMVDWLKNRARTAGQKAIQPALETAKPVDTSPVLTAINAELKPGLMALADPSTKLPLSSFQEELVRLRNQLTDGKTMLTDAKRLHEIQSDTGDLAFNLTKSGDPKDRRLGHQLRNINEKLVDQIDAASGGAYRPARGKFKDAMDISRAFEEGFDVLQNRSGYKGLEDRPEALVKWMKDASPEEVSAKQIGVRSDIDRKINGVKNQVRAGTDITAIPYNRQKLATLFGDKEAGRLVRVMENAQTEAKTNANILHGSKTAETTAAREAKEPRKVEPFHMGNMSNTALGPIGGELAAQYLAPNVAPPGLVGSGILAAGLGVGAARKAMQVMGNRADIARNVAYARGASATRGERQRATIDALLQHPEVLKALERSSRNALTP